MNYTRHIGPKIVYIFLSYSADCLYACL